MKQAINIIISIISIFLPINLYAQQPTDSIFCKTQNLNEVTVSGTSGNRLKSRLTNTELISSGQLLRAACCNLGESFTTNPSVDVSYSDAATGSKQIRLLGLSGKYVQMLTENIPNYRGAAMPYALGYIPGPWMQSIQVSKGTSSVKNGYEAIAGQINVEYKKPQSMREIYVNAYLNQQLKYELNANANVKLSDRWSAMVLGHYEELSKAHDGNCDGFLDMPKMKQFDVMARTAYINDNYVFQAGIKAIGEKRTSGQDYMHTTHIGGQLYSIGINTDRLEAFAKNAFIFNQEHNTNLALILSGSIHNQDATYGIRSLEMKQKNGYASLMFETEPNEHHALSAGLSYNIDDFSDTKFSVIELATRLERVPGAYFQYTYKLGETLSAQAGIRVDDSNIHGTFFTPRAHVKWSPVQWFSLRTSAGKGYRTNHPLIENCYLLASSRAIYSEEKIDQEEAWNYGTSAQLEIPLANKSLSLNAEYYYTNFLKQLVVDIDTDPHSVFFRNLNGKSRSHTFQIDATYPLFKGFDLTAAFRYTDVKQTIGGILREVPLTNRYKGLLTASYKTAMDIWQFDVTLQLNGGGRLPDGIARSMNVEDNNNLQIARFSAFPQLSAQITRDFPKFSLYVGGENLTNYKQRNPIISADKPFGPDFDATVIYAPIEGWMLYAGVRFKMNFL